MDRRPEIVVYVDSWRTQAAGENLFRVWMKWELPAPQVAPGGKEVDRWLTHTLIDCKGMRSQDLELTYYLGDALQTAVAIPEGQRTWLTPPPQTIGETTIIRACLVAFGKPIEKVP